jgi:hypothetical protein
MSKFVGLLLGLALLTGCATGGTMPDGGGDPGIPDSGGGDGFGFDPDADPTVLPLTVKPSMVQLDVTKGKMPFPTQAFTVEADGVDVTSKVTWSFGRPELGDIDPMNTFAPAGAIGGVGVLTATLGKRTGQATITVTIKNVVNNVSQQQQSALDNPSGTPDPATIVYPADDTFFPRGVLGPEMQWNGAQVGDAYKLEVHGKYYDYIEYFTNAPSSHLIGDADWESISLSSGGAKTDPLSMTLGRLSGMTAYKPMAQTWHVAAGSLKGYIYYWQLNGGWETVNDNGGKIVRLDPGKGAPAPFFTPPQSWNTSTQCWGCHSISRDGRTMLATFFDSNGRYTFSTVDLTKDAPGSLTPSAAVFGVFGSFNDKGDKIFVSNETKNIGAYANQSSIDIVDAKTGSMLKADAFPAGCAEPAWSPDGKHLAATCALPCGTWSWDCSSAELWAADVSGATVTNIHPVVKMGQTGRPYFSSFSPDSQWLAYAQQPTGVQFGVETTPSDLWITDLAGKQVKRLTAAMGGDPKATAANVSGQPRYAPLRAGGYSWVAFMSKRDYGNKIVGKHRAQIWVTAIDDPPNAADPSHPAFLLRGQDETKFNMRAELAPPPCKNVGDDCSSGFDCCGGQCNKVNGKYTCGMPPGCSSSGNACTTAADCCDKTAQCTDGYCQVPPPN